MAISVRPTCHRQVSQRGPSANGRPAPARPVVTRARGVVPVVARASMQRRMGMGAARKPASSQHSAAFGQRLVVSPAPHARAASGSSVRSRAQLAVEANLFARLSRVIKVRTSIQHVSGRDLGDVPPHAQPAMGQQHAQANAWHALAFRVMDINMRADGAHPIACPFDGN